jgi:Protein of unknown function (DUF2950)
VEEAEGGAAVVAVGARGPMMMKDRRTLRCLLLLGAAAIGRPTLAAAAKAFGTPEAATEALVAATRTGKVSNVLAVLGSGANGLLGSGDPVADAAGLQHFVELYDQRHRLEAPSKTSRSLVLGTDDWPFPIPLVKGKSGWSFDAKAGQAEILARRIGQNELDAIQVCLGYFNAQGDYRARNPERADVPHYADRLISSPGKRNGLYWPAGKEEAESPMGPAVGGARQAGYALEHGKQTPYHGYLYKILTAQGPKAEGGARDYKVNGKLVDGFALVAYPAAYGSSGIKTFLVNQSGVVLQKDLGPDTAKKAAALTRYDPDPSWTPAE